MKITFINKGALFGQIAFFVEGLTKYFWVLEVQYPHLLVIYQVSHPSLLDPFCTTCPYTSISRLDEKNVGVFSFM